MGKYVDCETVRAGRVVVAFNLLDLECYVHLLVTGNQPQLGSRIVRGSRDPTIDSLTHLWGSIGVRSTGVEEDNRTVRGGTRDFRSYRRGLRPDVKGLEQYIPAAGMFDGPGRNGGCLFDLVVPLDVLADGHRTVHFIFIVARPREGEADEVGFLRIGGKGTEQEASASGRSSLVHEIIDVG